MDSVCSVVGGTGSALFCGSGFWHALRGPVLVSSSTQGAALTLHCMLLQISQHAQVQPCCAVTESLSLRVSLHLISASASASAEQGVLAK